MEIYPFLDQSTPFLDYAKASPGILPATDSVPNHWEAQDENCELKIVCEGTEEWNEIDTLTKKDPGFDINILSIKRVQNKGLWTEYELSKTRVFEKNNGQINEKDLFHGTKHKSPIKIYESERGFGNSTQEDFGDRPGVYFAVGAKYVDKYAHVTAEYHRQVFLAKVITGNTYELPSLERQPLLRSDESKSSAKQIIEADSVTKCGEIFGIFEQNRAYPAYLITYRNRSTCKKGVGVELKINERAPQERSNTKRENNKLGPKKSFTGRQKYSNRNYYVL